MKRKVIKQGNNTLTITLPRDWSDKFGIKAGDELDLEEQGRALLVKSGNTVVNEKIQLDAAQMTERVLRWVLSSAHKFGYDEIEVIHQTPEQVKVIHELVKDLFMGFSVVEQTANRCLLKSISRDVESEFDLILRRGFLVTLSMADSSYDILKGKNFKDLSGLIALEHSNNQLTNFCERIINKVGHKDSKKNCFYYVVSWNLEKVCDDYKYLCDFFCDKNVKLNADFLALMQKVNQFFRGYYEVFYKFDMNELTKLALKGKELVKECEKLSKSVKSDSDFMLLSTLSHIVMQTMDFSASFVAIKNFNEP